MAARHQLTPLLGTVLADRRGVDPGAAAALQQERYYVVRRQAQLAALAGPYLDALRAREIPVIVLKGGILAERYYRRADDRPMHDVDLLVRPGDVEKALAAATDVGLERFDDAHTLDFDLRFDTKTVLTRHRDDLRQPSLDLHWALMRDWLGASGNAWLETAWQRSQPATFAGRPVRSLAPPDLLVHVVLHLGIQHAFEGLLWFCDVALIAAALNDRADWEEAIRGARRLGFGAALAVTLDLLDDLFDIRTPVEVRRRLGRRSPRYALARHLVRSHIARLEPLSHLEYLLPLLLMDTSRKALGTAWRRVVPSRTWLELRYPETRWPMHYVRHGLATARFAVRTVRGR
ncbi:MAG: hypothetical protein AUH30_18430 [Candidatus Rokubacteria bacterium 13_1_40CM_68_15]|nr:MAG: hypothetical protein AUH30_18430 [Candidatus Rokubacteria bacterium 13_1_40CM_68_15]